MANMKRMNAFILGVLAFGATALILLGLAFAPPCIQESILKQHPVFVIGFFISRIFTMVAFIVAGTIALLHAIRED